MRNEGKKNNNMSKKILIHEKMSQDDISSFKQLIFEEEKEIVSIINEGVYFMNEKEKEKVQRLITHYEHLKYFSCLNSDKWIDFIEPLKKQIMNYEVESKLNQKADKWEIDSLRQELNTLKNENRQLRENVKITEFLQLVLKNMQMQNGNCKKRTM